jgi:hypothetical protein
MALSPRNLGKFEIWIKKLVSDQKTLFSHLAFACYCPSDLLGLNTSAVMLQSSSSLSRFCRYHPDPTPLRHRPFPSLTPDLTTGFNTSSTLQTASSSFHPRQSEKTNENLPRNHFKPFPGTFWLILGRVRGCLKMPAGTVKGPKFKMKNPEIPGPKN